MIEIDANNCAIYKLIIVFKYLSGVVDKKQNSILFEKYERKWSAILIHSTIYTQFLSKVVYSKI